jgi:Ras-related protein Rab-1A
MSKGKLDYNHLFMIVMIGDSSVGKSCLLKKFVEPESQMSYNDNHMATVGVDFIVRTINVDGQLVKLQVWDTAGQERFRSVTSAYYRGAMGAIVCYDSLEEPTWRNTETWMTEFTTKAKDGAPMVLCGTKKDLVNEDSTGVVPQRMGE